MSPSGLTAVPAQRADDDIDWDAGLRAAFADPEQPRLVFQPIVDLRRGVVAGYEALARFDAAGIRATPDRWFAAADRRGLGPELEARVIRTALHARETLPRNCFLTINVSPHLVTSAAVQQALSSVEDLTRIVVELTEHVITPDPEELVRALDDLRARGATIALDDAGSGYSGLQQLAQFRPELVKVDRSLVDQVDRDEVNLALVELLGTFVGRLDAWLLAEGVERVEEMQTLSRLGVPLGQGWLFGRPSPAWTGLSPDIATQLRLLAHVQDGRGLVHSLLEAAPAVQGLAAAGELLRSSGADVVVVLDGDDRPQHLLSRTDALLPVTLRVAPTAAVHEVAYRAMARDASTRFALVVCTDPAGRYLGVLPVERLVQSLAGAQAGS